MISSSQRPLPGNTQHSQQTNIRTLGGIRTHDLSWRAAADLRRRPRGHWDRHCIYIVNSIVRIVDLVPSQLTLELSYLHSCTSVYFKQIVGRCSSVGIETHYGLDGPGIETRWGTRYSAPVQTGPRAHPASYTTGTGSFLGVKRPGRGVDHPPPVTPRLKKE